MGFSNSLEALLRFYQAGSAFAVLSLTRRVRKEQASRASGGLEQRPHRRRRRTRRRRRPVTAMEIEAGLS
jgi:hypothetical protein